LWNIDFELGTMIVKFPSDYPLQSPFLWLSSVNTKITHDMVLSSGAIYVEDIAPHKWTSNKKIYIYIKKIIGTLSGFGKTGDKFIYEEDTAFDQYCKVVKMFGLC